MQTSFAPERLAADPQLASSEKILRTCVHCGFCTATCPTYVLLGDELDSPRGRIYLIKEMLEADKPATEEVVRHVDRCLSCLSCMTTCPSGVNYMHLVDHARAHIEKTYRRPLPDRVMRAVLAAVLPYPGRFRLALAGAVFAKPFAALLGRVPGLKSVSAMLALAPAKSEPRSAHEGPGVFPAAGERTARVALLQGCAQQVLEPSINDATIRLLTRFGVEVVHAEGEGCCGSLVHHMGREEESLASARRNVDAWTKAIDAGGLDAIVVTTSGCGTTIKDYGFMLREDPAYAEKAARVSALARDVSEVLATLPLRPTRETGQTVAYHAACSIQHGQQIKEEPKDVLRALGFVVKEPAEGHLCCGSAGTYNILQPEIATRLRDRKAANLAKTGADVIAAGNIGCLTQIRSGLPTPCVHTVELADWATGGPLPAPLQGGGFERRPEAAA
ncbi:glycolate oxidase iron-sulfur subunit [Methylopila capsulata]|uniref:Glycolate oxidase iron-sulfur subunit n=1 Tax=Methylopila capsulata TaxID=61654 RepID=A0A9W6IVU0_9HYPH|nr:glycolate oxidase subunit GlcF [Methylopila capsulata]MBM7852315.1 glycolate oxidase iron-sulfur subunit [Methylopila capsulata]GLK56524.1 glycolate oxidase iron-sulfur subunit [Methylopila capsulata]